jgi:uncharacterized sulfatase
MVTVTGAADVLAAAKVSHRSSVVIILADDLGYGDLGCFNAACPFRTPNLDRMGAEGARLTDFYVPTPYCAPSRATLLTGRYPFRHTLVNNPAPDAGQSGYGLPPSEITLAEALKTAGYATAAIGKWHLGHEPPWLPRSQGFDDYFGILYSNDMFPVQLVHNEEVVEYPVVQATLTQRYTERALRFIEANGDRPFFLYLAHAMPHKPLAASADFYSPETPDDLYADVIAELDWSVGQILSTLKRLELDRKTLVIFLSDNGPWFGGSTGGLRGMKAKTWEGGLRVPLIARMPGVIPPGVVNDHPAASIDLFPTICRFVSCSLPDDRVIDGQDILPMLKDSAARSPHDAIVGMHGRHLATIRNGRWKLLVRNPGPPMFSNLSAEEKAQWVDPRGPDGVHLLAPYEQAKPNQHPGLITGDGPKTMMLFDLEADRAEQHDVAAKYPQVVKRLEGLFGKMNAQVPELPQPQSRYLFRDEGQGRRPLMRLIGGELRYDKIPVPQQHLLKSP